MKVLGIIVAVLPLALVAWYYRRAAATDGGLVAVTDEPIYPAWSTPLGSISSTAPTQDYSVSDAPAFELLTLPDWISGGAAELPADTLTTSGGSIQLTPNWQTPAAGLQYADAFFHAEQFYGLPANMLSSIAYQESRYNKNARSKAGAIGLMQFLPSTARDYGIDPTDPIASIDAAGRYMRDLYKKFGSWDQALAAYNWGQGNLAKKGLSAAPAETQNYFSQILARLSL